MKTYTKDKQFIKFCAYGFLKNLRFYDAFLLLFFLENGLSYSEIGFLYATREMTIIIMEIPSGIIADTYGRKYALIAGFLAYIVSFVTFYFSTDFYLLMVAIFLFGIGDAFRSGTHKGMIMDYLRLNGWEKHKIDYYGNTRSWSQKGSAVSALFAGFLVLYSGSYRFIYLFSIVPYLINFINIATYPNEINHSIKKKKKQRFSSFVEVFKNFVKVIRQPKVFPIMNSAALHSAFLKSIKDYIQPIMVSIAVLIPIMNDLDIKRKSGLIVGITYFFIFLMTSYASKNAQKVKEIKVNNVQKVTLLTGLTTGIICGVLVWFELWIISLLVFIVIYLIENARKPIMTGILSDNVPNEILTSVISAQSFYGTFITSAIAILLGFFADYFGIGIALSAVSLILILFTIGIGKIKKDMLTID